MVTIAIPALLGFGFWQLQRMHWKEALLTDLSRNVSAPRLDIGSGAIPHDAQFRQVRLQLTCDEAPTALRAGRNGHGQSGYSHIASCRTAAEPILLDAGWSSRPDPATLGGEPHMVEGTLVPAAEGGWLLVSANSQPPLVPSAPPGPETISNNHFSYAIQWFSFAAILAVIYGLWLRRWLAPPRPAD